MTDLEAVIYGALMHHSKPKTVSDFERAARTVAEMLERRQSDELERLRAQVAELGAFLRSRDATIVEQNKQLNQFRVMCAAQAEAAWAVVKRWDSPDWKDAKHTADYINALRQAITAAPAQQAEPVGFNGLTESETAQTMSVAGLSRPSLTVGDEPEDEKGLALWQLIYGAIAHEPLPLKVGQIEAAAKRVEDMLRRRAALAPAAQAEPRVSEADRIRIRAEALTIEDAIDMVEECLASNPPAQGKSLTEEQIVNDGLMMCPASKLDNCADAFEAGVKFAERAHGIGQAGKGSEG